jgi:hypothetical protein
MFTLSLSWILSLPYLLLSAAGHHDEIPDPAFLEWIKAQLDHVITLEPWVIVVILGLVVVSIPVSVVSFYLYQQRHTS